MISDQQPYQSPNAQQYNSVNAAGHVSQGFHAPEATPIYASYQPGAQAMPLPKPIATAAPMQQPPMTFRGGGITGNPIPITRGDGRDGQLDEVWINKAKEIALKTQTDPYIQSMELSRLKAAYLKSRYDKDIKVIEDQSQ